MAINANAGSKLYISPTPIEPDTLIEGTNSEAITAFEAISDWVEVEEVEDFGNLTETSEVITFTAVGNRRVRKLKGPRDGGTQSVVVGRDPLDEGQIELMAAADSDFNYPFKVELADARTSDHTKSVQYYLGLVTSKTTNLGNVSNVHRRNFDIAKTTDTYEVPSEDTSGA
ncbi:hypothetical protein [Henriciella sp.]|uniref:hypothetical protein n=1 Tax=Henriciella sp. TaxID=1968823 RepID=UPI000C0C79AC|nr:hypothetical protein [Henriciella sp.]PHR83099.1 MAG: hypothetical protein COA64_00140 [Henriciella sp.]